MAHGILSFRLVPNLSEGVRISEQIVTSLIPVAPRCPGHEHIELALDQRGRMHLLAREEALRELPYVERWARAHRELLAMALPDYHLDPTGVTVCHVFTDTPTNVADLHGSDLHLHLLTPVEIDGHRGWYAAPLNTPD